MAEIKSFDEAVKFISDKDKKPKKSVPNARKLRLYGLFKQQKDGDVQGSQPWSIQLEARAKWDEWAKYKGMSKEDAQTEYVKEVNSQIKEFEIS
uniref:ACB domain-containing protein n=1 Tax=Lotharella oceanica TaxID=641309 RepID=A0A7S2U011_9EUKA